MLNGRLYRAAFAPFLLALAIAAFSLQPRPLPLGTTLAPDAFEGPPALAELRSLAARFPDRRPGGPGDAGLAAYVAGAMQGMGGGFTVRTAHLEGQTIDGAQPLSTVIAQRAGSTNAAPILIVAHRDAAARGSQAELSGTAALLELARVFAARETKRTIVLASTSGGSGGDAGAAELSSELARMGQPGPFDAAIVLGDLAGTRTARPFVVPYSDGLGSAPLQLQRTVADAIANEAGVNPGAPSALGQLAHLMFPLAPGEQGVLNAQGVPAVLVQVSGERGPSPAEALSGERLQSFGRAVLSAVDALDTAPDISPAMQTSVLLQRQTVPAWALRLLVLTLLLPPLATAADGLARARRRRLAPGRSLLWTLSCALPFLASAVFAYLLGKLGVLGAVPRVVVSSGALALHAQAIAALVTVALSLAFAWLLWSVLLRRLGLEARPPTEAAGVALLLVLIAVAALVWIGDPFTVLLALPALHLWLLLASPELRPRRLGSLALVALGLAPAGLLIAFYAHQLGLGVGGVAWSATMLLAGGQIGLLGALLWSLALGCAAGAALVALGSPAPPLLGAASPESREVSIRGPMSYAGPGSLGGTESALRR